MLKTIVKFQISQEAGRMPATLYEKPKQPLNRGWGGVCLCNHWSELWWLLTLAVCRGNSHLLHSGSPQKMQHTRTPSGLSLQQEEHPQPWGLWGSVLALSRTCSTGRWSERSPDRSSSARSPQNRLGTVKNHLPQQPGSYQPKAKNKRKNFKKSKESWEHKKRTQNVHDRKSSAALGLLPSADNRLVPSPQPVHFIVCRSKPGLQKYLLQKCFQNPSAADQSCSSILQEPLTPQCGFTADYMKSPIEGWGRQLVTFVKTEIRSLKNPTHQLHSICTLCFSTQCTEQLECQHKLARFF